MSILERFTSPPQAPAAEWGPHSDRLRVITAGSVGNMEARLGTNGFDVVAAAETEDALIDAVSVDEPDAIVVEAELCDSLEHVRDLAPDAVLIAVGDHTPPARSVASSEACRGRRWPDSCTPWWPKASGRPSCGGSCPRSGQGPRCTFPRAWADRSFPRKRISSERTLRTRFATPRNS